MSFLSESRLKALNRIFGAGTSRAAYSLSEIVGDEVKLSAPRIQLYQPSEINAQALSLSGTRLGAVRQHFSGPLNAEAMLLFTEERTMEIVRDMMGSQLSIDDVAEFEQDAISELGNIILNGCLSAMVDALGLDFKSSLPVYSIDTPDAILQQLVAETSQSNILVLLTDLSIEKHDSQGYLVFLLSSPSLHQLLDQIERAASKV